MDKKIKEKQLTYDEWMNIIDNKISEHLIYVFDTHIAKPLYDNINNIVKNNNHNSPLEITKRELIGEQIIGETTISGRNIEEIKQLVDISKTINNAPDTKLPKHIG